MYRIRNSRASRKLRNRVKGRTFIARESVCRTVGSLCFGAVLHRRHSNIVKEESPAPERIGWSLTQGFSRDACPEHPESRGSGQRMVGFDGGLRRS